MERLQDILAETGAIRDEAVRRQSLYARIITNALRCIDGVDPAGDNNLYQ